MKFALVHDYLNQFGGGERVLLSLMKQFPEAPVFTLFYDKEKTKGLFPSGGGSASGGENRKFITSFLDFSFVRKHHRLFIPLMPLAIQSLNLRDEFDLIISDSHGFSKGIRYDKTKTRHISYIHTPLRYAWETKTYFKRSIWASVFRFIFAPAFWYVRRFDYKAGQRPDVLIANSNYIAGKIKEYYKRDSVVIYPPVDTTLFYPDKEAKNGQYYLALGRLLEYKRFDLIIEAFNKLGKPLKVVGSGRLEQKLKRLARENIEFLPFQNEDSLRRLYSGSRAFIMANEEDFGLVMAEAQACGTPVIAYNKGGAAEIVEDGKTGVLFNEQIIESLMQAVVRFESLQFEKSYISSRAHKLFSARNFEDKIRKIIEQIVR